MIEAASDSGAAQAVTPDDESVTDARRRDAFARLLDPYHPSLHRVARVYIANRAVADAVVQDSWRGLFHGGGV
jgi:DNA-directed RNA polymerase specialized sigma24 family protein